MILYFYCDWLSVELLCIIPSGAVASRGLYTETIWPFHIIDVNCTGVEMMILECSHNGLFDEYNCPSRNDASLRCQSMAVCYDCV